MGVRSAMIESFKTAIRPGLAIWSASMFVLSFLLDKSMPTPVAWICAACILEWLGERGIRRAKELFGK